MSPKKIIISLSFIALAIILVSAFWKRIFLICAFLIILAFLKHKLCPSPNEFPKYVLIGILGPITESLIMYLGGPWYYIQPQILNFPIWLPLLWGLAGILFLTLQEGIFD